MTSMCGFGALIFSGFPGLAQLGLFTVSGLLGAALATRFVMPVLLPEGSRGQGLRRQLGRLCQAAVDALPRLRWPLLALGVAAAALLAARGELWRADLSSLSPISAEALALDASLRADLSAGDARSLVVVQAADIEGTLQRAEAAAARLEPLIDRGAIGGWDGVTRFLPSLTRQRERLSHLPPAAPLRAALAEATRDGPLRAERLEPFLDDVQRARESSPITLESLRGTALAPLVDALLLQRADGSWVALLPLQPIAGAPIDSAAVAQALQGLPGTQLLEIGRALTQLYERYLGEAQAQALLGALGVVAVMALALRSWRRLLAVCQPLLLAVLLTMGALALLQVHLGILHLVGLLLVVAVGSNYALFFNMLQRDGHGDPDMLASLLLANLTTVLSFGLIAMSAIPALSAIGRVVAPGALLALLLSAAFAPRPAAVP